MESAEDRFLRMPEVMHITGLSKAQIYFLISKGQFPKQVKLGARASAWRSKLVRQWCDSK